MDLGRFSNSILELLGDDFLESHDEARNLILKLGEDADDCACVFSIDPLAYRTYCAEITESGSDFAQLAGYDRIQIGNKILERVNEVLYWRRYVDNLDDNLSPDEMEEDIEEFPEERVTGRKYLDKKLVDVPKPFLEELEKEIFEEHGNDKPHYNRRLRAIVMNFSRSDDLLMDFIRGAIPARWLACLPEKALASKDQKAADAQTRKDLQKDAQLDPEAAELFAKAKSFFPYGLDVQEEVRKEPED